MLSWVSHVFVQNKESRELLGLIGIKQVTVSGDTRFDRVEFNAKNPIKIKAIEEFCESAPVFIGGSTWPDDEKIISNLVLMYPRWKFIIAPHEVNTARIEGIEKQFPNSVKLSSIQKQEIEIQTNETPQVLIIDSIGLLSSIYQYGHIAYIGGGFGVGIHNTLEAAAFGLPLIFGPNYSTFIEAVELIKNGSAFSVNDSKELNTQMELLSKVENRIKSGLTAREYVSSHTGATKSFLDYIYKKGFN
jgi:3-deoxy-D-manno-octulosonic-acid transferase